VEGVVGRAWTKAVRAAMRPKEYIEKGILF
jgi:hypothetical protein